MRHLYDWHTVSFQTGHTGPPVKWCQIIGALKEPHHPLTYIKTSRVMTFDGSVMTTETGSKYRLHGMSTYQQEVFPGSRVKLAELHPKALSPPKPNPLPAGPPAKIKRPSPRQLITP